MTKDSIDFFFFLIQALLKMGIVVFFAWMFFRWKKHFLEKLSKSSRKPQELHTIKIIDRLSVVFVVFLTALFVLESLSINITPLLTFGGLGAAIIGVASKDVIANFGSGLIVQWTVPFIEGDFVILPEKHIEGTIENAGLFQTTLRDKEQREVILPNSFLATSVIINGSKIKNRLMKQTIKIPFEHLDKIPLVTEKIYQTLQESKKISHHPPSQVILRRFGEYAYEIELEAYSTIIDQALFNQFQQQILLNIAKDIKSLDIPIALPTTTCHLLS